MPRFVLLTLSRSGLQAPPAGVTGLSRPPRAAQIVSSVSSMRFDPSTGTVTPAGTVCTVPVRGRALHNVVNIMGRVRTCSPAAAGAPCAPC